MNDNDCMLTTIDNPFDPFEHFDSWLAFDVEKGYDTCGFLAKFTNVTDDMSEQEEKEETNRAIDEIIYYDFLNKYKKCFKTTKH